MGRLVEVADTKLYVETMLMIPGVELDERRLADICERYGIAELKISLQTRPTAGPDSDIDGLYTLRPGR